MWCTWELLISRLWTSRSHRWAKLSSLASSLLATSLFFTLDNRSWLMEHSLSMVGRFASRSAFTICRKKHVDDAGTPSTLLISYNVRPKMWFVVLTARRRRHATISAWSLRLVVLMERTSSSFWVSQASNKHCEERRLGEQRSVLVTCLLVKTTASSSGLGKASYCLWQHLPLCSGLHCEYFSTRTVHLQQGLGRYLSKHLALEWRKIEFSVLVPGVLNT